MPHFWFIRHGQATHNVDAIIRGEHAYFDPVNTDAALTDVGHAQAQAARDLIPEDLNAIYCSPSRRCRQTLLGAAAVQAEAIGVTLDDRLMEPQGDALCNKRIERAELAAAVPSNWTLNSVAEENPFQTWVGEGYNCGSSGYGMFVARVRDFTEEILMYHGPKDQILIVSHHDWIRTWFSTHLGQSVSPANCAVLTAYLA
jgi:broad specificity phosphatase PhoE